MKALGLLLLCVIGAAVAEKARFDNYRVYRLNVDTAEQLNVLQQVENYPDGVSSKCDDPCYRLYNKKIFIKLSVQLLAITDQRWYALGLTCATTQIL